MYRIIFFLLTIFLTLIFGWWLFIPLALLSVYLAKLPYEIIVAGVILDSVYYFGSGIVSSHRLGLFALLIIFFAMFLGDRIYWRKTI